MLDRRKLRELMRQEGKFKVYSEQDLIKPISKLLKEEYYQVPLTRSMNSDSGQIIFKNLIENYFLDFLGANDTRSCVPVIMNPRTGELHKDYTGQMSHQTLGIPYRAPRSVFTGDDAKSNEHEAFEGSPKSDFVYATGDCSGAFAGKNVRVLPMEFFAKYINTKEEKNNSEFMFIRYATSFGSQDGMKDPNEDFPQSHRYCKPSLENNIHYSKIKYFEDNEEPFVYVENRRLSIIKKRHFTNLTINKDYYNNLLASLSYVYKNQSRIRSPLANIMRDFYDGKYWGNSYDLSFNSIKASNRHPSVFDNIKECDAEDYLVFDDLDFSYNKSGTISKSYVISPEGMYTVNRKDDQSISINSPKNEVELLSNFDDLAKSINLAIEPAFENYKDEERGSDRRNSMRHFKSSWINSEKRNEPINYLFSAFTGKSNIGAEGLMKIKQTSIYKVLDRIYSSRMKLKDETYRRPKNSSKLALNERRDEVQILADYLASSNNEVYKEFLKDSYKVTIDKLRRAFEFVPTPLRGTKEDYEKGNAIDLGGKMYLKLMKYTPFDILSHPYGFKRGHGINSEIIRVQKAHTTTMQIKLTLGWLLSSWYEMNRTDCAVQSLNYVIGDVRKYLDWGYGNSSPSTSSYSSSQKNSTIFSFSHNDRKGLYAVNYAEFNSLEIEDRSKIADSISKIISNKDDKTVQCEPLFEPTQYKVVAKDSAGNIAYSIVRPFISVDIHTNEDNVTTIALMPSLPMHSLVVYSPKLTKDPNNREILTLHVYSNRNEELLDYMQKIEDPLPVTDLVGLTDEDQQNYRSRLKTQHSLVQTMIRNPIGFTLRDLLTGSLSSEKHPDWMSQSDYMLAPMLPNNWMTAFSSSPSRFFKDYHEPDILFGKVGEKYKKLKKGDAIKDYFKGTSWELLRIDAWLGLRPVDRSNLNLHNPEHWVNQRALLDCEFFLYMISVFAGGAYHLPAIVEAGLDTRELNFETYDDRSCDYGISPHRRGPYGVAIILNPDIVNFKLLRTLSHFAGCYVANFSMNAMDIGVKGFECFLDSFVRTYQDARSKVLTTIGLMGIRDGKISSYTDFIMKSFGIKLEGKTEKERKAIRNRLHKFLMSPDYIKAVLMTSSQLMVDHIASGYDIKADIMAPVEDLREEIRIINHHTDFGQTQLVRLFKEVFSFDLYRDETLNYSAYEIFRYLKSLVVEQRVDSSIIRAATDYKNYLKDLYVIKEYGKIDLSNRKIVFPDALRTQADIMRYNRELIKDQEEMKRFRKGSAQYEIMEYSNSKYTIRMAKSPLELQMEGSNLGHCVGSYVNQMAQGENIIFFLRERKDPEKSNVTVEFVPTTGTLSNLPTLEFKNNNLEFIMRGHINQVQGMSRRSVNKEEALFLNEWRTFVQSQMRKKINIIPSFGKRKRVRIRHEFIFGSSIQNQINGQIGSNPLPVA